jgi:Eukaryotic aspartyl protease
MTGAGQSVSGGSQKSYSLGATGIPILFDSGSTVSYLPPSLISAIATDYPGAQFDPLSGFYNVSCDAPAGSVDFSFGTKTVKVPYSDFIWHKGAAQCVLGMMPETESPAIYILGDSFLRAAYVVFDVDNQNIWIDQADDCGSNIVAIGKGASAVPQIAGCHCGLNGTVPGNFTTPPPINATKTGSQTSPTVKVFEGTAQTIAASWIMSLISIAVIVLTLG